MSLAPATEPAGTLQERVQEAEWRTEQLSEALQDAVQQLALDDRGWQRLGEGGVTGLAYIPKSELLAMSRRCRAGVILNPLLGRAVNVRIAYIWGQGVTISADDGAETGGQDVNQVIQSFLDDDINLSAFTSTQAREENERALETDGNVFFALPTDPVTGRVQIRSVPFLQVEDVIRNPDDADDVWFYRRTVTRQTFNPAANGATLGVEQSHVYHPSTTYRPRLRVKMIDNIEVLWDQPMVHLAVNRLDGWKFGVGDIFPAVSWAAGYSQFLQDWARLMKALSKIAYTMTAKSKAGAAQVRTRFEAGNDAGQVATIGEGQKLEAVGKSGASIDAESGRPLAAMVAAATDLPVTMLLCDPGVSGARAVAETLDRPTELIMGMRQQLWAQTIRDILNYVIDASVRAPRGELRGRMVFDPVTDRERITLVGDQNRTVDVVFPDLRQVDPGALVGAVKAADDTGKLPPLLTAKLLMRALQVENPDEELQGLQDGDGNWVDPSADHQAAAQAALAAMMGAGVIPPDLAA